MWFPRGLGASLVLTLLVSTLGCREDAESPTGPAADLATTTAPLAFGQISVAGLLDPFTCAVTTDARAYCWGLNTWGQLGIGLAFVGPQDCGNPCTTRPLPVVGDHRWLHVVSGSRWSCGLTTDNRAWCWGRNVEGQLGSPTDVPQGEPIAVAGNRRFKQIRAGVDHACAITLANVAFCWGNNSNGQLGDGTTTSRSTPVRVLGDLSWRQVTAGFTHTCGVTLDYKAYCWGGGGVLGDGTTNQYLRPRAVAGRITFR